MTYHDNALRRALLENIDSFMDRRGSEDDLRHAAVSIVVVGDGGEAAFLLTKRSPRLNAHPGNLRCRAAVWTKGRRREPRFAKCAS